MLSFNTPPWQTSLLAAAQQRSGRRPSHGRAASEVLPRLFLTDLFTARDESQLSELGITHVVSVMEHAPMFPQTRPLRTLHIPLSDSMDQDVLTHLPVTTSFIRNALAESPDSRVLVRPFLSSHFSFSSLVLKIRALPSHSLGSLSHGHQPECYRYLCISHRHREDDTSRGAGRSSGKTWDRFAEFGILATAGRILRRTGERRLDGHRYTTRGGDSQGDERLAERAHSVHPDDRDFPIFFSIALITFKLIVY